jgi:hypothetical protein
MTAYIKCNALQSSSSASPEECGADEGSEGACEEFAARVLGELVFILGEHVFVELVGARFMTGSSQLGRQRGRRSFSAKVIYRDRRIREVDGLADTVWSFSQTTAAPGNESNDSDLLARADTVKEDWDLNKE